MPEIVSRDVTLLDYFPARRLLVKESPAAEFTKLGIGAATLDPAATMPPLPASFTIRDEMTAVEDQGRLGTCTSFCVVACLEHLHQRDLSEAQVTHEAEHTYGDCKEGLALIHAYQTCATPGAVAEGLWQYDDTKVCWTGPPDVSGAARHQFGGIGYVYNRPRAAVVASMLGTKALPTTPGLPLTLAIQSQLFSRRRPVSISVPVVWQSWPWSGVITMPPPSAVREFAAAMTPPNTAGWHCLPICGWDNTTGRLLFKNSWGATWGDSGYGTIPYQYIEFYSDVGMVGW